MYKGVSGYIIVHPNIDVSPMLLVEPKETGLIEHKIKVTVVRGELSIVPIKKTSIYRMKLTFYVSQVLYL